MAERTWHDINEPGSSFMTKRERQEQERQRQEELNTRRALDEGPAATREQTAAFTSSRWYQADDARNRESPSEAGFGDVVILELAVEGIVQGAGVDILVQDHAASAPFMTKRTLRARVKDGSLRGEWKIERGAKDSENPDYRFEAHYSGSSGRASSAVTPIPLQKPLSCDFVEIADFHFASGS